MGVAGDLRTADYRTQLKNFELLRVRTTEFELTGVGSRVQEIDMRDQEAEAFNMSGAAP